MRATALPHASLVAILVALTFQALVSPPAATAYTPRVPILIDGNGAFTGANGVTGGTGTPADPYLIDGWEIDASAAHGIEIRNTDAHAVVRDVFLHSGGATWSGMELSNVENLRVDNATIANNWRGINAFLATNLTIESANVTGSADMGMDLESTTNLLVADNTVSGSGADGIFLFGPTNATLRNNTVTSSVSWEGFTIVMGSDVTVVDNNASGNAGGGIIVENTADVLVGFNTAVGNPFGGVHFLAVTNAAITGNELSSTDEEGIYVAFSDGVTITGNTVASNALYGIYVQSSSALSVYHNNLIGNAVQAFDDAGVANNWDNGYPGGGNYWSDYGGADNCSGPLQNVCTGGDSFGDTPYVIDADSQDDFPLMFPWPDEVPPVTDSALINGLPTVTYDINSPLPLTLTAVINDTATGRSVVLSANFTTGPQDWASSAPMALVNPPADAMTEEFSASIPWPTSGGTWLYCPYGTDARGNGNAASTTCASLTVNPDTTPPTILNLTAVPDPQEYGGAINVTATITDPAGVAAAVLNATGEDGSPLLNLSMTPVGGGVYALNTTYETLGNITFTLWASDAHGNWASAAISSLMEDTIPPVLAHAPVQEADQGDPILVRATVTDAGSGVESVTLHYRGVGAATYATLTMAPTGTADEFEATIPAQSAFGAVLYYLEAADVSGNLAWDPEGGGGSPHAITILAAPAAADLPVWVWPVLALLVAALGIALTLLLRRRRAPEAAAPSGPTVVLDTAAEGTICGICLGAIKPGLTVARCASCGKVFHDSCAHRVANCPSCESPIDMDAAVAAEDAPPRPD